MERLSAELNEEKRRRKEAGMTSRALATDAEDTKTKNAALQKVILKRFSHTDFLNAPPMLLFSSSSFSLFAPPAPPSPTPSPLLPLFHHYRHFS